MKEEQTSIKGTGNVNRDIIRLAVPAIINNITVPLLGLCDTAIAGHLGDPSYIGAMAVGAMMLNVIFWLCGFLRAGTTGLTAQAVGSGSVGQIKKTLCMSLQIGGAIAIVVLIAQMLISRGLLAVIRPDAAITDLARRYFQICIWGVPAQLAVMAVSGWFIGLQNTLVPMVIAVGINVVNIIISLTLVIGFKAGFTGIAVGTLTANWIGAIAAMLIVMRRLKRLSVGAGSVATGDTLKWKRFFSVNSNLFFRSACIMLVSLTMTSIGARNGEITLAVNAVMMQFFLFFSYFMDGFAFAGEATVGRTWGSGDYGKMHRYVRSLMRWGVVMALLFLGVYGFGSEQITSLLTDGDRVRQGVDGMRLWVTLLPPITVAAFIYDGIFIGLARTRVLLVTTLTAAAIFFVIALGWESGLDAGIISTVGSAAGTSDNGYGLSNKVLWTGFELYLLLRGLLLAIRYERIAKKEVVE